ncbi:MmoB/DmpM family protein [Hyphomicrobium sp. MC1]|uniref:MmoB/DmpM family protein n=1 Tax=Hyphomicrobium sp. (strain MC1) TaxID=717785 RepID=UPI000213EF97|nr:MmoB/DmpM family protein [Hyphomicrobium sp. MC1]CCB65463.1 Toluene-4-monooxygenase system protein D [Hyphomicrobium sp. MC1]
MKAEDANANDFVGPIISRGEMSDAVKEAVEIDNPDREKRTEETAAYVRIEARGECIITFKTMSEILGRKFSIGELERNMPGFAGFIRTDSDQVRFVSNKRH